LIKKFIAFAVDKSILNHILFILMLIMALFAYKQIPKELFPPANLEMISITGSYPGASADILDKMAVKPIEDDLKSVSNISDISSVIKNGFFKISLELKEHANPQLVLNDVKDVIANAKRDLPADMNEPVARNVIYQFPLLLIAVSGDAPKEKLLKVAKKLKSRLSNFKDLGVINIRGDADYTVKIELNSAKIDALNLNRAQIFNAISSLSSIFPAGTLKNGKNLVYISSINGEKNLNKLKNTIISVSGKRIRLKDIATVTYGLDTSAQISHYNGKENISLNVTKTKRGNAIELSKKIKKVLKEFKKEYPNINFKVYTDTSVWIKNRINLVTSNLFFGLILVFISILLSVNWKISAVVALGIPTSFFIGLIFAKEIGYSMNMISMLGALLALGMLVDEAIVVGENIYRHLEMGKSPRDAAIDGSVEMFPAVLTATGTTVFAFLPLLIMSGKMGMFVKILPVMITVLLLSSLFEAFYFLPLHAKELFSIKSKNTKEHKSSPFWEKFYLIYGNLLEKLLKRKYISTTLLVIFIILGTIGILKLSKFELFPKFDAENIYISGKVDINNKVTDTEKLLKPFEQDLLKELNTTNDIDSITSIAGLKINSDNTFETGDHLFEVVINLKERKPHNFFDKYINPIFSLEYDSSNMQREHSAFEILKKVENIVKKDKNITINGKKVYQELSAYVPQTGIVKNDVEVDIVEKEGLNSDIAIKKIEDKLKHIKGVTAVSSDKIPGPIELKLKINKYGQNLGFSESYLINSLRGLFLEAEYGKMLGNIGIIRITLQDKNKDNRYNIKNLKIQTPDGQKKVALKDIADFIYKQSQLTLYKDNAKRVWSVSAQTIKGKITASEVMKKLDPIIKNLKSKDYEFIIKGEEEANKQVKTEMTQAAIIAIFLIFIALVLMFNSLILPLLTISVIPLSLVGAFAGTKLLGLNLTMIGFMGIVGLAGIVVNDAIIMLDFIKGSKNINEIVSRAKKRLRPIMLTSITTVLGLSTLMFFASGQALIVQPMAVALGFGVAWATVLNLIYIPLIYSIVYKVKDEKTI